MVGRALWGKPSSGCFCLHGRCQYLCINAQQQAWRHASLAAKYTLSQDVKPEKRQLGHLHNPSKHRLQRVGQLYDRHNGEQLLERAP